MRENIRDQALFNNFTFCHHADAVSNLPHNIQIMRDEENGHPRLGLQISQKGEDLRLNGDIERGCWFIRDQQLRLIG